MFQINGILCFGPNPKNMALTVVYTRKMRDGQLAFFRIGVVPRIYNTFCLVLG